MTGFVEVGGARLWVSEPGVGTPVLLSNGGPGCCDYLGPVAALFKECAVTRWEQRGCGRSGGEAPFTLRECLEDMEAIRRHLAVERWIVAGHSWGADLSLLYALHCPERVAALVCLSGGRVHNDRDWHAAYSSGRDAGREPALDFQFPPNLRVNEELNAEWKRFIKRPGLFADLARLAVPALFIYGEEDIRPSWPVEQVATLMPRAEFQRVAGAGHNLWLTHADELGRLMGSFTRSWM